MSGWFDRLSDPSPLPVGTRIELVRMGEDPDPVPLGSRGTVLEGSNGSQIYVKWDNGRSLMLLPTIDRWRVIHDE